MKAISIVCDACGHHAAGATGGGRLSFLVRSGGDALTSKQAASAALPRSCPCCGVLFLRFQAGDEFLIGLTQVSSSPVRSRSATAAML
jgi:hypothetical protein